MVAKDLSARSIRLKKLPRFTVIGATTRTFAGQFAACGLVSARYIACD
jgi:Holliday junction resolvasome RuvABC ATP-dependent DNA helicase subunit